MPEARRHEPVADTVEARSSSTESSGDLLSFVEAHEERHGTSPDGSFYLSGTDEHDRVELSEELFEVLKLAAAALGRGQSVSIMARDQEITTQQAAELLGVSRPTVVKLIDSGTLRAHVPGAVRRKLRLTDVLAYRDDLHERRSDFISQSSREYAHDDTDLSEMIQQARRES